MLTEGRFDNLPDVKQMLPFVFLSSVVVFKLIKEDHHSILTCSQPNLSILGADGFDLAPPGTSPGDPNVARIFDVVTLPSSPIPVTLGQIPLSPSNPEFAHRRLWRLPIAFPMILTALFSFISNIWNSEVEEIRLALEIRVLLRLSKLNLGPVMAAAMAVMIKMRKIAGRLNVRLTNSMPTKSLRSKLRTGWEVRTMMAT